jgi:hypothetical protein
MSRIPSSILVALLATAAACGGAPPPSDKLTATEAAIRGAREVGAESVPKASLQLKLAEEALVKAKALIAEELNDEAHLVLQRAQADAELALALAKDEKARAEAQQVMVQVAALKGKK